MGYSLSYLDHPSNDEFVFDRRVDSALQALRIIHSYHKKDWDDDVRNDVGQRVSRAQLLEEAARQATDPASQQQLTEVLADHIGLNLQPWDDVPPFAFPPNEYWKTAGEFWARAFQQVPPDDVLQELERRYECGQCCGLLKEAAQRWLNETRRTERVQGTAAAGSTPPIPPPAQQPRPGRSL